MPNRSTLCGACGKCALCRMEGPDCEAYQYDDPAPTRSDLAREHAAVLREYHALRNEMKEAITRAKAINDFSDYKIKQQRLDLLKRRETSLRERIVRLKQTARERHDRREKIFIDLARARLGEDVYREIWTEVDRLETEQWRETWSEDDGSDPASQQ